MLAISFWLCLQNMLHFKSEDSYKISEVAITGLRMIVAVHEPAIIRDMMVMKNFTMLKMFLSAVSAGE